MTTHVPFEDETAEVPQVTPEPHLSGDGPLGAGPAVSSSFDEGPIGGSAQRPVTCPGCGQPAVVSMNRRLAADFCPRCDYPLFWTPSEVYIDPRGTGESLRRLPGAVGRQSVGSAQCPHCAERNLITAQTCVRCGGAMRLAPPAPPRVAAPPPPAPVIIEEPAPENDSFWLWVSVAIGVALAILVALLIFKALS